MGYARVLYAYYMLVMMERQESAQRAVEAEELVYGIAHAHHDPGRLSDWRAEVRRRVGLLESPRRLDRVAMLRMSAQLEQAKVVELDEHFRPVGG